MKTDYVLHTVKEERNSIHKTKERKADWIGHILHINIEVAGRRRRRRNQLLDGLKEVRYCKLKEETPDRPRWRTRFGKGCGPFVRQKTE